MHTGAEHWEILSDDIRDILDQIADRHHEALEMDIDDMEALYEPLPAPAPVPWATLGEAFVECDRASRACYVTARSLAQTIRAAARAS